MFPDPSTSPARYTKSLFIGCPREVVAADAGEGGWIQTFPRVVELEIGDQYVRSTFSLVWWPSSWVVQNSEHGHDRFGEY